MKNEEAKDLKFNVSYPTNPDYDIETQLVKLDLDGISRYDICTKRGFRVTTSDGPKKDILSPTSIYSNKFGETTYGENPYSTRYKCECGYMQGKKYSETICPKCKTEIVFVDDDFSYFGYLILDNYKIIHPIVYNQLSSFIGKHFENIIHRDNVKDKDGLVIEVEKPAKEPFYGIGMIEFQARYFEILSYYKNIHKKTETKMKMYEELIRSADITFTDSIPVYTVHLRPILVEGGSFHYDGANKHYNLMAKYVHKLNSGKDLIVSLSADAMLYAIQMQYMGLYKLIIQEIHQKSGEIRGVFGGRYNFTARAVIIPRPGRVDELELPFVALAELLQQSIINVLVKTNSMTPNDAHAIWSRAKNSKSTVERGVVKNIINNIIKNSDRGIPVLLNRNPTIEFGSIQQFYVTSMNEEYYIGVPLQILEFFAADFDGDALNVMYITNKAFRDAAVRIFNPRNAFYISHNDGYVNMSIIHNKDLLVNINSLRNISKYDQNQLDAIKQCLNYKK